MPPATHSRSPSRATRSMGRPGTSAARRWGATIGAAGNHAGATPARPLHHSAFDATFYESRSRVVSVTARKIRDHGRERPAVGVGRIYTGYLISYPTIGRGMVIFRDPNGHRMVTTP